MTIIVNSFTSSKPALILSINLYHFQYHQDILKSCLVDLANSTLLKVGRESFYFLSLKIFIPVIDALS